MAAWTTSSKVRGNPDYLSLYWTDLELTGDTILHAWEVLGKILQNPISMGIICDVGMYANTLQASEALLTLRLQANRTQKCDI